MGAVSKLVLPAPVLDLRRRLEQWRRSRPKLGPVPGELWRDAVQVARAHGIHRVSRALRLEYNALKRHLAAADLRNQGPSASSAFIEVAMPPRPTAPEYLVEMERPDGGMMRIRLTEQAAVVALSESFWRCRS